MVYKGVELTADERKKIEVSKQVLQLAKDPHRHAPKTDAYQLPDAYEDEQGRIDSRRREDVLTARHVIMTCIFLLCFLSSGIFRFS